VRAPSSEVEDVLFAPGLGGFFYDDQGAVGRGAASHGFLYAGTPVTPGFSAIRMPAQSLGIGLRLADGSLIWGDMMSVQYPGVCGREAPFDARMAETFCREHLVPRLRDLACEGFRASCERVLAPVSGVAIPRAIQYGVSQLLLKLAARHRGCTMAELICLEFQLPVLPCAVPIYAQSGDARAVNVEKMILKNVDILPHGLINSRRRFGREGKHFRSFVHEVARRVLSLGGSGYRPLLHFDVYGMIGVEIGQQPEAVADFIASIAADVAPLRLQIESPVDYGGRPEQIEGYAAIVAGLRHRGCSARIVVDEHCNSLDDIRVFAAAGMGEGLIVQIKMPDVGSLVDSIEAVLMCKANGVGAYLGGSCTETDLSAIASVHVAVATQADMMLAKPGMGVDEALTIVGNEQARLITALGCSSDR